MFENKELRRIYGTKKDELGGIKDSIYEGVPKSFRTGRLE
jgi:hypothetical protein